MKPWKGIKTSVYSKDKSFVLSTLQARSQFSSQNNAGRVLRMIPDFTDKYTEA